MSYRDSSGNNPLTEIGNQDKHVTASAVRFDDTYDPSSADVTHDVACRGYYIGVLGNLNVVGIDGNSTLFTGLVAGTILDVQSTGTLAASTTTTDVIPLY